MDSLTARHLARELDARWRGKRLDGCGFDRDARAVSLTVDGHTVRFELGREDVRVVDAASAERATDVWRGWTVRAVRAPIDDRRIIVELVRPGRFKGSVERRSDLVVSALPRARGALLRDAGGAKLATLGADLPASIEARPVLTEDVIAAAARAGDAPTLLGGRWMSPILASWMIANPADAVDRYHLMCSDAPARPARCGAQVLPFPFCEHAELVDSLIEAGGVPRAEMADHIVHDTRQRRAIERMRVELERARDAPQVRAAADAIVAMGDVTAPATVRLASGVEWPVGARPGERAPDAAQRLYADARSKERALASLPARLAAAPPAPRPTQLGTGAFRPARSSAPRPPYRTYRSSGGIAIWVGRGAASNDELTFGAAAPDDVWLHARDAAGAHVVLRWPNADAPPARDLREAASLAAWHSKARGAAVVPVDWTRRKHVRKPRGAKPGTVILREERTIMARPDAALERRLRDPR